MRHRAIRLAPPPLWSFEGGDRLPVRPWRALCERRRVFEKQRRWRIGCGNCREVFGRTGEVTPPPAREALRIDGGPHFLLAAFFAGGGKRLETPDRLGPALDADGAKFAPGERIVRKPHGRLGRHDR